MTAVLTARWGGPIEVSEPRRLSGGASRETWVFGARAGERERRLVLRRDPPTAPRPRDMAVEAAVLSAAAHAGVPVPALRGRGDGSDGVGSSYLLMDYLDGETIPRRLLREPRWERARAGLAGELGRVLARIHAIPPEEVPGLADQGGADQLERLRAVHDGFGEPRPALEVALRWLAEHRPPTGPRRVVHGDFRNGNLMLGPDGLRAVLDWELAHLGDPVHDLGWLCVKAWRFGARAPVGGFGEREELLDGYAQVAGWRPSEPALRWWEVFGTARWAVICRQQAQRHLGGAEPSVELAVLGRRLCESEHDVLLALGLTEPVAVADPLDPGAGMHEPPTVHDRPTVHELLDAARGFLTDELTGAELDQRVRFHARVAANALAIARRELLVGQAQRAEHAERLAALGCADDHALVAAIRSGTLDARRDEVLDAVRALTTAKLTVANPRYLAQPGA
ncbi:MAG: phosphotransferase family protein [Pseudonocardia sp.]|nr:phosphotransferase family protein [Pseudonocardia sp.]